MSNLIKTHTNSEKQPFKYRTPYQGSNYNNPDRRNTKSNYSSSERRTGNERRDTSKQYKEKNINTNVLTTINKLIPVLEKFLVNIIENNKQNAEIQQKKIDLEERKLDKFESLGKQLIDKLSINIVPAGKNITPASELESSPKKNMILNQPKNKKKTEVLEIITEMRSQGETYENIAIKLKKEGFSTFSGRGVWHAQTVHRICQSLV